MTFLSATVLADVKINDALPPPALSICTLRFAAGLTVGKDTLTVARRGSFAVIVMPTNGNIGQVNTE